MPARFNVFGALLTSLIVAAASLSARFVMWIPPRHLQAWLPWLQASAAGLLLGDALLHMLPEAMAHGISASQVGSRLALGILGLLMVECVVRSFGSQTSTATFARMDIVGDTLHHAVDGIVIGAGFAIDPAVGLVVALAITAHELPREMSNAGVLIAGGYLPRRAFLLSVATTTAVPLGALSIVLAGHTATFLGTSLALAAGTTIYLACGDLLPGLWQNVGRGHRFTPALGVAGGMAFMWAMTALDHAH